jgi:hypothetical protein
VVAVLRTKLVEPDRVVAEVDLHVERPLAGAAKPLVIE